MVVQLIGLISAAVLVVVALVLIVWAPWRRRRRHRRARAFNPLGLSRRAPIVARYNRRGEADGAELAGRKLHDGDIVDLLVWSPTGEKWKRSTVIYKAGAWFVDDGRDLFAAFGQLAKWTKSGAGAPSTRPGARNLTTVAKMPDPAGRRHGAP